MGTIPTAVSALAALAGWLACSPQVTGLGVPNIEVLEKAAVEYVRLQGGCPK